MFSNKLLKERCLSLFLLFFTVALCAQKKYVKTFYKNGRLKTAGWLINDSKVDYWKFYYKNGALKKEGHFKNNLETKYWYFYDQNNHLEKEGHYKKGNQNNWWIFYDKEGNINHKCQLLNNKKNGYCLIYNKRELIKASKYKEGKKIKEWTDFSVFKSENNLNDLRE